MRVALILGVKERLTGTKLEEKKRKGKKQAAGHARTERTCLQASLPTYPSHSDNAFPHLARGSCAYIAASHAQQSWTSRTYPPTTSLHGCAISLREHLLANDGG